MATTLAEAIRVLRKNAENDAALAETIRLLAEEGDGPDEPFADPGQAVRSVARLVNERRQGERRAALRNQAIDTAGVIELIDSIQDRKGVDRRRRRGTLMGWRAGRRTLHPEWQFDRRRGDTRPGLERVLAACREIAFDPFEADALMTTPRDDLDGGTLAELFARGQIETVVQLILSAGDQS
jgi:hypothetical protein